MEIIRSARPLTDNLKVAVWHCRGCEVVHLSLGRRVLDLTGEEFADLTAAVAEANYQVLLSPSHTKQTGSQSPLGSSY